MKVVCKSMGNAMISSTKRSILKTLSSEIPFVNAKLNNFSLKAARLSYCFRAVL
jgi:hypothetical protein